MDTFGDDIKKSSKKEAVSIIWNKQFALIKPATKTRIMGLEIRNKPITERLVIQNLLEPCAVIGFNWPVHTM